MGILKDLLGLAGNAATPTLAAAPEPALPAEPPPAAQPRHKPTAIGKATIRAILVRYSGGRGITELSQSAGLVPRSLYRVIDRGVMPSRAVRTALVAAGVPAEAWCAAHNEAVGVAVATPAPAPAQQAPTLATAAPTTQPPGASPPQPTTEAKTEGAEGAEGAEEVEHLRDLSGSQRANIRALEREVQRLRARVADRTDLAREVGAAFEPLPALTGGAATDGGRSSGTLIVALTDWHIGEVVSRDEMGGTNEYHWKIASEGVLDIARRMIWWADSIRATTDINEVAILSLGDMISGTIHEELAANAEFPAPVAAARAGELLAQVVALFAERFPSVRVVAIAGNHERLSKRVPAKRTNEDSLAYLCHTIAAERLRESKHVAFHMPRDPMPRFEIHGRAVAALHGHQIKAGGISPYYGIARRSNAMARERSETNAAPPSAIFLGHFHHFATLEDSGVILCPSLIGATEWSRQQGFRGVPGQLACVMGKRGLHGFTVFERRTGRAPGAGEA